jgi:hypothetical protein
MGGLGGIAAGLIGSAQGEKSIDLNQLLNTIAQAGQYQKSIINALPPQIMQRLQQYAQSLQGAGQQYQGNIENQLQKYQTSVSDIYGPNSEAAIAANAANLRNIYSQVPGTENAIRNALAATGGLQRGNAGVALAQPYVQAANQYGQTAAGVTAQQTAAQQQAKQQALNVVNQMEAGVFQNLFGMSKEQATTILNTGNAALQNQLAELITQSQRQTEETLGVQGIQAQNAYQNALQQQGYQSAIFNGLADVGIGAATGGAGYGPGLAAIFGGLGGGLPAGADVNSANYYSNLAANMPPGLLEPR